MLRGETTYSFDVQTDDLRHMMLQCIISISFVLLLLLVSIIDCTWSVYTHTYEVFVPWCKCGTDVRWTGPTPKIKPGTDTHDILDACKTFLRQVRVWKCV